MMPHVFDWIVPEQLGACVNPYLAQSAQTELLALRIGLLVNLHERPDPPNLLVKLQAQTVHLPVPDSHAPTQDQLDRGVAAIDEALREGTRVAVHCGAGLGRSGTLIAAYLVSQGSAPDDAIALVRSRRPGSIETAEQEAAVHQFARRLLEDAPSFPVLDQVVLDTTEARHLAEFYRQLLGFIYRVGDEPPGGGEPDERGHDWLVLHHPSGWPRIAFQQVTTLRRSTWPGDEVPQQLHLDMTVPTTRDLELQHQRALDLGATLRYDRSHDVQEPLRVYADPAGHPFCIFVAPIAAGRPGER